MLVCNKFICLIVVLQAQGAYDELKLKLDALASVVNEAEDEVFAAFCQTIGVANIREYEERQLKVARAESEARLQFETQIARLTHQYVCDKFSHSTFSFQCRCKFVQEQVQVTEDRLEAINTVVRTEEENIAKHNQTQGNIEEEITEAESTITQLQEELKEHNEVLEEKSKAVEQVKRTAMKASKVLDQALKEIATRVCASIGSREHS